jgi:glycosyltransferase involved in cell wall biosynthesis
MPVNTIHATNNATKEELIKFNTRSSIIVIPHGIDPRDYDNLVFNKDYENYVLFIGRLVFYKNLDVVISSFKEVVKKLPDVKLIIIGNSPMRGKWKKTVSELDLNQNVEFTGYISQEKKIELLSKCYALLLPNIFEGFGLVLLEAFAMNKPVLVADVKLYDRFC